MGSRYGRNQKKRHRARVQELEARLQSETKRAALLLCASEDLGDKLRLVLRKIEAACPNSVALPPKMMQQELPEWTVEGYRELDPIRVSLNEHHAQLSAPCIRLLRVPLGRVAVWLEDVVAEGHFRTAVHFRVPGPKGGLNYVVAEPQGNLRNPGVAEFVVKGAVSEIQRHEDSSAGPRRRVNSTPVRPL